MDRTRILAAPQADAAPVVSILAQGQGVVSLVEEHPSDPAPGQSRCAGDLLCYGAMPELEEASIRLTREPPPGRAGAWTEAALRMAQDHGRRAMDVNDVVVDRLFWAGLALETALGLMGDYPGAGKVQEAIGELDLAIRDVRNVVFDHHQPDPLSGEQPG